MYRLLFLILIGMLNITASYAYPFFKWHSEDPKIKISLLTPEFLREGDKVFIVGKIKNTSNIELTGQTQLQITNYLSGTSVDGWFTNSFPVQYFTVPANDSVLVHFPIQVPYSFYNTVKSTLFIKYNQYTDSTATILPVYTNRAFIQQTLLYNFQQKNNYTANLDSLLQISNESISPIALAIGLNRIPYYAIQKRLKELISSNREQPIDKALQIVAGSLLNRKETFISSITTEKKQESQFSVTNLGHFDTIQKNIQHPLTDYYLRELRLLQQPNGSFYKDNNATTTLLNAKILYLLACSYSLNHHHHNIQQSITNLIQPGINGLNQQFSNPSATNTFTSLYCLFSKATFQFVTKFSNTDSLQLQFLKQKASNLSFHEQALLAVTLQQCNDTDVVFKTIIKRLITKTNFGETNTLTHAYILQLIQKNPALFSTNFINTYLQNISNNFLKSASVDRFSTVITGASLLSFAANNPFNITANINNTAFAFRENSIQEIPIQQLENSPVKMQLNLPTKSGNDWYGNFQWQYLQNVDNIPGKLTNQAIKISKKFFVKNPSKENIWETYQSKETLHIGDTVMIEIGVQSNHTITNCLLTDNFPSCIKIYRLASNIETHTNSGIYSGFQYKLNVTSTKQIIRYYGIITTPGQFSGGIATIQEDEEKMSYAAPTLIQVAEHK
ncbi:hypothetical protein LX80_00934 [Hydrotalea sandarakina]|uniref:Alpha-2-macroglobulin family protein n=2 Tax=Hydrotalea sandarakina TaxID=1004304 RepID=A0A2W7RVI3_9BACT|nr:hypothetical protein LX80_00934 [Hydrotalea sandarakina]